jgi:very-short-patch-repair endonuclease
MRESAFNYASKIGGFICPRIGSNESQILDNLEHELGVKILRQYKIGGYFLDGYIPEMDLAIEVDEKHHQYQTEKDKQREEFIKSELKCQFLRIKDY